MQIDIRGTLTIDDPDNPGETIKKVFQKTAPGAGNISNGGAWDRQERAHVIPYDPQSAAQLERRAKFADAVATWQAMSGAEKQAYRGLAKQRNISPFNAFLSTKLKE